MQLYAQLYSALKTFLSRSSETRQKAGLAPESARWTLERKLVMRCKPQRTTFQEGKVPETTIRKKACGKSKSQSFPIKISLTLGIIEHLVSCCPEIWKRTANYQIQMGVSKQLTFSKTFEIIYMPFLHARAKHLLKRFHWRSRVHTIYLLLIQTSVHLLVAAGPQ